MNRPAAISLLYGDTDQRAHGYFPYYRRHLGSRRLRRNLIVEIGVEAPIPEVPDVGAVHVYPGITFIEKAAHG